MILPKHSFALPLFLMTAASKFNTVSAGTAFETKADLLTALKSYCDRKFNENVSPYGPIGGWDVSGITDMASLFGPYKAGCNPEIGSWDVSNVITFANMFYKTTNFNQDISGWDVSSGTNFANMFRSATNFNQDISGWDVSSGTNFHSMFASAWNFNQDICGWDVSSGTNFNEMFNGAVRFDQTRIYCKWQSNNSFTTGWRVCKGSKCGWGERCMSPSLTPSSMPSSVPSASPSMMPSSTPSGNPSSLPSNMPSSVPSTVPSSTPSVLPSDSPSSNPSSSPSALPSNRPSQIPSDAPSMLPSMYPSSKPSSCFENPNSKWFLKMNTKTGDPVLKTCKYLKRKSLLSLKQLCRKRKKSFGGYSCPLVTCPTTCSVFSGHCI